VIIDISNPSREIKFTDDGLPRKTRKSSFHGWGLHNVAQAVEKYNGTIQFEYKDGIFTASAMLFFPQKPRTKETATKDR
jgi:sensor histidine kinase regulating citrate/malate metabolism